MRGCAPKVSIPLEGKVPSGDIPSLCNKVAVSPGRYLCEYSTAPATGTRAIRMQPLPESVM